MLKEVCKKLFMDEAQTYRGNSQKFPQQFPAELLQDPLRQIPIPSYGRC
jgi:hypothetical protein